MVLVQLVCLVIAALLCPTIEAQCTGRTCVVPLSLVDNRQTLPPAPAAPACTVDDISSLILLAQALGNNKECPRPAPCNPAPATPPINVENIINKLINALVYTTTQTANNNNQMSPSGGKKGQNGQGLIDVSLLGQQGLLALGIGGSGKPSAGCGSNGCKGSGSSSSNPLIEVDLLEGNKLLGVDIGNNNQDILGLYLGGEDNGKSGGLLGLL